MVRRRPSKAACGTRGEGGGTAASPPLCSLALRRQRTRPEGLHAATALAACAATRLQQRRAAEWPPPRGRCRCSLAAATLWRTLRFASAVAALPRAAGKWRQRRPWRAQRSACGSNPSSLAPCAHPPVTQPSHKSFKIKRILGKKQKQNRPIPQWIRMRTDSTIR